MGGARVVGKGYNTVEVKDEEVKTIMSDCGEAIEQNV